MTGIPSSSEIARMSKAELIAAYTVLFNRLSGGKHTAEEEALMILALQHIKTALHFRAAPHL